MEPGQELACVVRRQHGALGLAVLEGRRELSPEQVSSRDDKGPWR